MDRNRMWRRRAAAVGVLLVLGSAGCSGASSGGSSDGGVGATDNQPVATSGLQLGGSSVGGVTVSGASLKKTGSGIAVLATVSSDHPDRLVSIATNYTTPLTLPKPLSVAPGAPTTLDPTTAVLRPAGPIDDGASVAVSLTFATAGIVQVYAAYHV